MPHIFSVWCLCWHMAAGSCSWIFMRVPCLMCLQCGPSPGQVCHEAFLWGQSHACGPAISEEVSTPPPPPPFTLLLQPRPWGQTCRSQRSAKRPPFPLTFTPLYTFTSSQLRISIFAYNSSPLCLSETFESLSVISSILVNAILTFQWGLLEEI